MSEEIAYDVESGPGPQEPAAEALQPAAPVAETPQAEPAREPEVEVDGQRHVPLSALLSVREENKALKDKAARLDQIEQEWNSARPYVDFLRANPDLLKPRQAEPAPVQTQPEDDPDLVTLARTLDLYTPDGKPDAKRASALATFMDKRAGSQAQEAVKPLAEQTVQQQVATNFQHALTAEYNGLKPDPQILRQVWQNGDPKQLATREGAASAAMLAILFSNAQGQKPAQPIVAPPTQEPVVSEAIGGKVGKPAVSAFEEGVMKTRGINLARWTEATKGFKPGQVNTLED